MEKGRREGGNEYEKRREKRKGRRKREYVYVCGCVLSGFNVYT